MLDTALPDIVQERTPGSRLGKVFGGALGNKNMTRIRAVHHSLRDIYPSARDIVAIVYIMILFTGPL